MFLSHWLKVVISDNVMEDIMKIVNSFEESDLLIKGASETIENQTKKQKGRFIGMLLGILGTSLLGNLLVGKE